MTCSLPTFPMRTNPLPLVCCDPPPSSLPSKPTPPSGHLALCLLAQGPAPSSSDGSYFGLGVTYSLPRAPDLKALPHPPHPASPSFIFFNHTQNVQKSLFIDLFAPVLLDLPSSTHQIRSDPWKIRSFKLLDPWKIRSMEAETPPSVCSLLYPVTYSDAWT